MKEFKRKIVKTVRSAGEIIRIIHTNLIQYPYLIECYVSNLHKRTKSKIPGSDLRHFIRISCLRRRAHTL